jgi:competence protein ComEC
MGVSFQMSFAAVVALIAFYESFSTTLSSLRAGAGPARRAGLHLLGIALTTLVATVGTIPFTIYHFGRFALYSVLANVVAVPLAGIWILPWAFVACLLMPFHLDAPALVAMSWGIRVVEAVARWTSSLPRDVMILPAMPDLALLAISFGGLWCCLWRGHWRSWGLIPILAGFLTIPLVQPPDLFLAADGRLVALRGEDGRLYLSSSRRERFTAESWETAAGAREAAALPETGIVASHHGDWACDPAGCIWGAGQDAVMVVREPPDDDAACPEGRLVIALRPLPARCRTGRNVLDPTTIAAIGAQTVWLGDPLRTRSAGSERGNRPWIPLSNAASGRRDDLVP